MIASDYERRSGCNQVARAQDARVVPEVGQILGTLAIRIFVLSAKDKIEKYCWRTGK